MWSLLGLSGVLACLRCGPAPVLEPGILAELIPSGPSLCASENPPASCSTDRVPFRLLETQVFGRYCGGGGCHDDATAAGDLSLEQGAVYDALVWTPAGDVPAMFLVEPFEPAKSFVMHTMDGTAASVGSGVGLMPAIGESQPTPQQIEDVRTWIAAGAPND